MTRKKVKMALIENESVRKSTFKKRKRGILKKAQKLAILYDVPICVLIKSEYDSSLEVWPSREKATKVLSQWEMSNTKKMVNQETSLLPRISKETESLEELLRENRELKMKMVMLGLFIGQYLKDLKRRIEILRTNDVPSASSASGDGAAATSSVIPMHMVDLQSSSAEFYNNIRIRIENTLNKKCEEMGL